MPEEQPVIKTAEAFGSLVASPFTRPIERMPRIAAGATIAARASATLADILMMRTADCSSFGILTTRWSANSDARGVFCTQVRHVETARRNVETTDGSRKNVIALPHSSPAEAAAQRQD